MNTRKQYTVTHLERNPIKYYQCSDCGEIKPRSGTECKQLRTTGETPPEKLCLPCQTAERNWKHGTENTYTNRKCRCKECRDYVSAKWHEQEARRVAETGRKYTRQYPGVCALPRCGKAFTSTNKNLYCSAAHGAEGWQSMARFKRTAPVLYDQAFADTQQARIDTGAYEAPPARDQHWISEARRGAIYERDSLVCQICYEKCLPRYSPGDRLSPSLDHVWPRTYWEHGHPHVHDDMNLRTAHIGCNSSRQRDWDDSAWLSLLVYVGDLDVGTARELRAKGNR